MPVRPQFFVFTFFLGAFASGCSCGTPPIEIIDCDQLSPAQRDPSCGPRALAIVDAPRTLPAGACVALPLQTWDAGGKPSPVSAETVIDLQASTGAGAAFSLTADCATPVTAVTLPSGGADLTVYFRSTVAGEVSVTATSSALSAASHQVTVTADTARSLVFGTPEQAVVAGECSSVVRLETRDEFGNRAPVTEPRTVSLSSDARGGFTFYEDPGCTRPRAELALANGADGAAFYFQGTQTGTVLLGVTGPGFGRASQPARVVPSRPSALAITSPPRERTAGACAGPLTFQLRDAHGNPSVAVSETPVELSAPPENGVAFFADPDCTTPGASQRLPSTAGGGTFFYVATVAGTAHLTASGAQLAGDTREEPVLPAAARALTFGTPARTVTAGACSDAVTLRTRDVFGNASPVTASTALLLSGSGLTLYSDPGCTTEVTDLSFAAGTSSRDFFFRGTTAGLYALSAEATGLPTASQPAQVAAGAASRLRFVTSPRSVVAGSCSAAVMLQAQDVFGNPSAVATSTPLAVALSPAGGAELYADAGCTQPLSGLTLPNGRMEGTFYFRGTQAQAVTFTANAAGFASATQGANILPAPARALVFTSAPQTPQVGACSARVELELRDAFGNAANAAAPTALGLGALPSQGLTFYADASCTQPVMGVNVATGARGGGFYVLGTVAGAVQLSAAGNGLTAANLAHTLTPAPARALAFVTPPWTVAAGTCSGALTVQARDTYGNASAVAASTGLDLSGTPATGLTFYADPGCTTVATTLTVPQGASTASFYFVGTSAGTFSLTTQNPGLGIASQTQTVVAGALGRLAFTTAPQSVQAGSCSGAAVLRTEDSNGNPSPNPTALQINLAPSAPNGFTLYADPGCTTPVAQLSVAPGAGRGTFYFRGTVAQTVTVSAFANGVAGASQVETITAAPASALAFDSAPQAVTVGSCSAAATVGLRDGYGNPAPPAQAVAVGLVATPSTGFALYADPGCTTPLSQLTLPAGGGASFYFLGTRAGDVTLGASAAGFGNASQVQTLRPLPPSRLAFLSSPQTMQAGECSAEAVVQVQDAYGNATPVASGAAVGLSALPSSGFAFYLDAGCTAQVTGVGVAAGTAVTRFHVRGTSAGNVTVTASSGGLSSASQPFVLLQPPPNQLVFRTPAQTLLAGACSAVARVESLDAFGNPSPAALDIGLSASPAPGLAFYADPDCTQPVALLSKPEGNSLAGFYVKGTSAGAFTLTASSAGLTPATQPVTILPMVRSGTCNLPQTDTQTRCALSPPLQDPSRTFFIFQATNVSASDTGSQANIRCTLSSTSYISCQRALKGTPVRIHWSLVERAQGLRVQHLQATCAGATTSVQLQPVIPEQTFLLLSSEGTDTSVQGGLKAATLTSATTAVIEKQGSCSPGETSSLQVVEYTGATVTRGTTPLNGLAASVPAADADLSRSFLLFSYRASTTANPICTGAVRGELTGPGSIAFSRGFGNGNCDNAPIGAISWERVQLPLGNLVQQLSTTLSGSTRRQSVTLAAAVDTSRSFAVSGGQWASGQTMGEGSCDSSESMEDMRARLELLSSNTVELTRETSCAQARFTPFVIQLQP